MDVKVGDRVLIMNGAGQRVKVRNKKVLVLRQSEILCLVDQP